MRKYLALWLAACWLAGVAHAQPQPSRADLLATWGAYQAADQAYQEDLAKANDPATRMRLLERRLALADLMGDPGDVAGLAAQLEALKPDAATRMSIALARGNMAYRLGHIADSRRAFAQAEKLAEGMPGSPSARFVLYAARSFAFWDSALRSGRPTTAAYRQAFARAQSVFQNPPGNPQIMDVLRSAFWNREWVRKAAEICVDLFRSGRTQESEPWGALTNEVVEVGRTGLTPYLGAMECIYAHNDLRLEEALGFANATVGGVDYSKAWLEQARGEAQFRQGHLNNATAFFGQPVVYNENQRLLARLQLAQARYDANHGQPAAALQAYDEAARAFAQAGRPLEAIDVHNEVALGLLVVGSTDYGTIKSHAATARADSERLSYTLGSYFALFNEGTLLARQQQLAAAEAPLRGAVAILGDWLAQSGGTPEAKQQVLEQARLLFDTLINEVLLKQNKRAEAMEVLGMQQKQTVLAQLDTTRIKAPVRAAKAFAEVEKLRGQNQELTASLQAAVGSGDKPAAERLRQQLAANKGDYLRALNTLKAADPSFAGAVSIQPTSFAKIKDVLPEGVVLVQYGMGKDKLYLFVARQGGLQLHEVAVGREALKRDITAVRKAILEYPQSKGALSPSGRQALATLYDTLIKPLEPELATAKLLVVAPTQDLFYLPFAALLKDDKYLIQRIPLATITGLELIEYLRTPRPQAMESLLALGNPDGSLPAATQEVASVAELFPTKTVYMGPQATRDKLANLNGVSVLHLATHGVLDSRDANQSYLLLANGHLATGDIYEMEWKGLGLVTLSACQTALARLGDGAEISCLAQAFSVAGGHSMLASLWSVSDDATRQLMVAFYDNLLKKKLSRALALQQAQVTLLSNPQTAHPFLWAAFELIGDWR